MWQPDHHRLFVPDKDDGGGDLLKSRQYKDEPDRHAHQRRLLFVETLKAVGCDVEYQVGGTVQKLGEIQGSVVALARSRRWKDLGMSESQSRGMGVRTLRARLFAMDEFRPWGLIDRMAQAGPIIRANGRASSYGDRIVSEIIRTAHRLVNSIIAELFQATRVPQETRELRFLHMSQRAYWSMSALRFAREHVAPQVGKRIEAALRGEEWRWQLHIEPPDRLKESFGSSLSSRATASL